MSKENIHLPRTEPDKPFHKASILFTEFIMNLESTDQKSLSKHSSLYKLLLQQKHSVYCKRSKKEKQ